MDIDKDMERRTFLRWCTHGLGVLLAAVLGFPAIAYLIDPRNRKSPPGDFKLAARLSELEKYAKENNGAPKEAVLRDERRDAWTLHPDEVLGRVQLVLNDKAEKDEDRVVAFTSICPHLGCSINFDRKRTCFLCPCHGGTFRSNGEKHERSITGKPNPAPRNMDRLEVKLEDDPENPADKLILVKYESFAQGHADKVVKK